MIHAPLDFFRHLTILTCLSVMLYVLHASLLAFTNTDTETNWEYDKQDRASYDEDNLHARQRTTVHLTDKVKLLLQQIVVLNIWALESIQAEWIEIVVHICTIVCKSFALGQIVILEYLLVTTECITIYSVKVLIESDQKFVISSEVQVPRIILILLGQVQGTIVLDKRSYIFSIWIIIENFNHTDRTFGLIFGTVLLFHVRSWVKYEGLLAFQVLNVSNLFKENFIIASYEIVKQFFKAVSIVNYQKTCFRASCYY